MATVAACPSCGASAAPDARFCSQCGTRLEENDRARRQHTRLPPRVDRQFGVSPTAEEAEVVVEWLRGEKWSGLESVLVDVGRGGIGVVCDEPLPVGTQVRAILIGPEREKQPARQSRGTRASGRVAYCAPVEMFAGLPCYRCGIAFDKPQPRFVEALAGPAGGVGYLVSLGDVAAGQGDVAAARRWYEESLALCQDLGERGRVPRVLESLAVLAALDGEPERALRLAGAAAALREHLRVPSTPGQHARVDGALGAVRWGLSEDAAAAAYAAGQKMHLEEAVAYALEREKGA